MPKVYLETYGCTLNQADSDILRAVLIGNKHQIVDNEAESDVVVLNTCTVKGATDNKITERVRQLRKAGKRIVIAGCMTANEAKLRKIAPLAPLVGTSSLRNISDAVDDAMAGRGSTYKSYESKDSLPKLLTAPIARIPINDGCVSSCNFCQTKLARPFLRSYSPKTVVKWIDAAVAQGAKEIQLTSMDLGAYGLDIKTNLVALLDAIANNNSSTNQNTEFLVRLGMINPDHAKRMLPDIIRLLKHKRFYRFIHIPVQTGSEKVCREMNRAHTVKDFVDIVEAIRKEIPEATIATDIIVGYPTETEDDYEQTKKLILQVKPDITNVSRFSPRPGTKAKELKQLPNPEVKRRSTELAVLVKKIGEERRKAFIGKRYRVLITEKQKDFTGRNINYSQVVVKGFKGRLGDSVDVEIVDANHGSLFGILI
ncbi:MAG: tRNA (N(6)-L-threonylcarbamoyladenosine(37)-C(2))-methylthiotransferase [Candidatus ainarchaeum sp.]|nr:tRNA (N(6)-L-threonylcarbamoyladenosine(37)-C(2))-methylthiotransferase [Candidatus ainarchaeum sp.]